MVNGLQVVLYINAGLDVFLASPLGLKMNSDMFKKITSLDEGKTEPLVDGGDETNLRRMYKDELFALMQTYFAMMALCRASAAYWMANPVAYGLGIASYFSEFVHFAWRAATRKVDMKDVVPCFIVTGALIVAMFACAHKYSPELLN